MAQNNDEKVFQQPHDGQYSSGYVSRGVRQGNRERARQAGTVWEGERERKRSEEKEKKVRVGGGGGDRGGERERDRDRDTETETHRESQRQIERHTARRQRGTGETILNVPKGPGKN